MVAFNSQGVRRTSEQRSRILDTELGAGGVGERPPLHPIAISRWRRLSWPRAEGLAPEDAARYAALAARFRALVEREGDLRKLVPLATPIAETDSGATIAVADLLIDRCPREPFHLPLRSIDPELVHEACELLRAHPWRLPDLPAVGCR